MLKYLDQTLMEQLQLNHHEIEYRKHLFDFTDEDVARLVSCKPVIEDKVEDIVNEFYRLQARKTEVASIIGDADTLARLHGTLRRYVRDLVGGQYGMDYVGSRLRVGKVHRRMSVTPKLYMSSVRLLQSLLDRALDDWGRQANPPRSMAAEKASLHKLLLLDAQFVLDAYIDCFVLDVDAAKREVEAYAEEFEIRNAEQTRHLRELSTRDSLTGLYNHRAFYDFLDRELAVAERHVLPLSLVCLDLDGFKVINDTMGHQEGDCVLAAVGMAILDTVRKIDIPCRYGGDEFCLILPRTHVAPAEVVCDRLIECFRANSDHDVSFSIGVAQTGPHQFVGRDTLLRQADMLMYQAKERRRATPGFNVQSQTLKESADGDLHTVMADVDLRSTAPRSGPRPAAQKKIIHPTNS